MDSESLAGQSLSDLLERRVAQLPTHIYVPHPADLFILMSEA
jgi:hypothetical protein